MVEIICFPNWLSPYCKTSEFFKSLILSLSSSFIRWLCLFIGKKESSRFSECKKLLSAKQMHMCGTEGHLMVHFVWKEMFWGMDLYWFLNYIKSLKRRLKTVKRYEEGSAWTHSFRCAWIMRIPVPCGYLPRTPAEKVLNSGRTKWPCSLLLLSRFQWKLSDSIATP